jgi:uncharacterized membrane protein
MTQTMVEHHASVVVNAPIHQVYTLFSHFNDFPKFMSFVKEVTYHDQERSHWVAEVAGSHEWDAVNEDWIPDRQIGWRSFSGLNNYGRVIFSPVSAGQTQIDVYINYHPPVGVLGTIGEHLGAGKRFEEALQNDLNNFAEMVKLSPANALDPNSSQYLFHKGSAAAQGKTTERQNATMGGEFSSPEYTGGQMGTYGTPEGGGYSQQKAAPPLETYPQQGTYTSPGESSTPPHMQEFVPSEGTSASAQGNRPAREDTLMNRPILDKDIVEEPPDVVTPGLQQEQTPGYPGRQNFPRRSKATNQNMPEMPSEQIPPQRRSEPDQPQP